MNLRTFMALRSAVAACAFLVLLPGCGGPKTGSVAGRVTYQGKPVVFGQVSFLPRDGVPRCVMVNSDGTYLVTDVPVGESLIMIVSPPPGQLPSDRPPISGWFELPQKYLHREESGLKLDVQPGHQEHDLTLE